MAMELVEEIRRLKKKKETPSFWRAIINCRKSGVLQIT